MRDHFAPPSNHETASITQACFPSIAMEGGGHVALLPRAAYEARYTPTAAVIGFAFETQSGTHAFASDREIPFRARPNGLAFIPAGCDVVSRSDTGGEYLAIRFSEGGGHNGVPTPPCSQEWRFSDHIDPAAIAAAQNLRRMLLARDEVEPLFLQAEIAALREAVSRVFAREAEHRQAARWMTARRLRLIEELIEAKLESRLTVEDLAAALQLSSSFFTRAFKAAVGQTPHNYIIERRLSRARTLLRGGDNGGSGGGLAEIAAACGFASHAHMTALFRQRFGVSPNKLRSERK